MSKYFSILFLLCSFNLFSQKEEHLQFKKEDFITFDLVSPFYYHLYYGNSTPRWRVGYIYQINQKHKVGLDLGYGNVDISLIETEDNYSLWEIRPEYYFIFNPKKKTLKYFSIEAFYIYHKEIFINQTYFTENRDYYKYEKANYLRQKYGVNAKIGMFINFSKHIGLNIYTGIGIRNRSNDYYNIYHVEPANYDEDHYTDYHKIEGNHINAEFNLGLKFYLKVTKS